MKVPSLFHLVGFLGATSSVVVEGNADLEVESSTSTAPVLATSLPETRITKTVEQWASSSDGFIVPSSTYDFN